MVRGVSYMLTSDLSDLLHPPPFRYGVAIGSQIKYFGTQQKIQKGYEYKVCVLLLLSPFLILCASIPPSLSPPSPPPLPGAH